MFLIIFAGKAQDITGDWAGALDVQGVQLRVVFHITKSEDGLKATMDSPDQGAKGIPVNGVTFERPVLKLDMSNIGANYEGSVNDDFTNITGIFTQGGHDLALALSKKTETELGTMTPKRPQTPKEPFPYYSEDVVFNNTAAGVELAGTLTLPDSVGKYPVVVLISGSGPQDRNEELMNHKPFLVLSDYLTRHGIGVLRYDDRGIGASKGDFAAATSADFATDAFAAVEYLKTRGDVMTDKIGLAGHSEGGMIAPMVAADHPDDIAFIVLLAGPGTLLTDLLQEQVALISRVSGASEEEIKRNAALSAGAYAIVQQGNDLETEKKLLESYFDKALDEMDATELEAAGGKSAVKQKQITTLQSPWFRFFITFNPADYLKRVKCPVLAVNGSKDLQVPAKSNLPAIKAALDEGGNTQYRIVELEGLNHLFQKCETGAPAEYAKIEETMNPKLLETVTEWINKVVK